MSSNIVLYVLMGACVAFLVVFFVKKKKAKNQIDEDEFEDTQESE